VRWNKQSVIIVLVIFTVSYIYSLFYEHDVSNKTKAQYIEACNIQKIGDCDLIDQFHNACFEKNYRSWMKTKRFYAQEYEDCLEKNIATFNRGD